MEDNNIKIYGSNYIRRINNIKSHCNQCIIRNEYIQLFKFLGLLNIEVTSICKPEDKKILDDMHKNCYKSYLLYKRMLATGKTKISVNKIRTLLLSWQQKLYDIIHSILDVEIDKQDYSLEEF